MKVFNKPVDYLTAVMLKQKGYNEPCLLHYSLGLEKTNFTQLQAHIDYSLAYSSGAIIPIVDNFFPLMKRNSDHPNTPSAPTIGEVLDWFFTKEITVFIPRQSENEMVQSYLINIREVLEEI